MAGQHRNIPLLSMLIEYYFVIKREERDFVCTEKNFVFCTNTHEYAVIDIDGEEPRDFPLLLLLL